MRKTKSFEHSCISAELLRIRLIENRRKKNFGENKQDEVWKGFIAEES